jgi:DNA repair photolyase
LRFAVSAVGFGTTPDPFGQIPVHWKITRAALECFAEEAWRTVFIVTC